jgi:hypothetical protein
MQEHDLDLLFSGLSLRPSIQCMKDRGMRLEYDFDWKCAICILCSCFVASVVYFLLTQINPFRGHYFVPTS